VSELTRSIRQAPQLVMPSAYSAWHKGQNMGRVYYDGAQLKGNRIRPGAGGFGRIGSGGITFRQFFGHSGQVRSMFFA
jgi:hypothetical protein